jgi:hypothetical protein
MAFVTTFVTSRVKFLPGLNLFPNSWDGLEPSILTPLPLGQIIWVSSQYLWVKTWSWVKISNLGHGSSKISKKTAYT